MIAQVLPCKVVGCGTRAVLGNHQHDQLVGSRWQRGLGCWLHRPRWGNGWTPPLTRNSPGKLPCAVGQPAIVADTILRAPLPNVKPAANSPR